MFPPGLYCRLFIVGDLLSEFLADDAIACGIMVNPAAPSRQAGNPRCAF
jgi:hypothetical protein